MLDKAMFAVYMAYWNARTKLMKLANEEDGMETLETVILIAVAVIIAGIVIVFLLGEDKDGKGGIISIIFDKIKNEINGLFD